jgi:hypothetical protein
MGNGHPTIAEFSGRPWLPWFAKGGLVRDSRRHRERETGLRPPVADASWQPIPIKH